MNNLKNLEEVSNKQVNLPVLLSFPHQSIYFNSCLYYFEVNLFKNPYIYNNPKIYI